MACCGGNDTTSKGRKQEENQRRLERTERDQRLKPGALSKQENRKLHAWSRNQGTSAGLSTPSERADRVGLHHTTCSVVPPARRSAAGGGASVALVRGTRPIGCFAEMFYALLLNQLKCSQRGGARSGDSSRPFVRSQSYCSSRSFRVMVT